MKKENFLTGRKGEEIAAKFLEEKGFSIKERNFRTRFGEIDIVCYDKDILVFVEVKTKIGHDFGEPEEMVGKGKLAKVQRMGEVYTLLKTQELKKSKTQGMELTWEGRCRVDVVGIVLKENGEVERIRHYEAVY